ncbi:transporter substrate-binding domain-containing protein [Pseudorhodoferax soli]|uniref:Amino acid ABC transporter substrate-binding protein (PAAT family) n=1 Tax=Pseudorhodoferax soli TaxID=545864 RepID=A0A368XKL0_9BURK|nr:transporter substrate-binding domain-containing protein [Pseudorhodoferax soli]RCW68503.1 amino acid ABC transporter substrate-binding protein (PAAT family) [Pseudorhodoferax soli]
MRALIHTARRRLLWGGLAALLVGGCAAPSASPPERSVLAPTGTLRVGVYLGSPTSLVVDSQGRRAGVALEMGQRLGQWLGVPVQAVEYPRVAEVVEAVRQGKVDFTVTNASPARAQLVDFSAPLLNLELGYLVPRGSRVDRMDGIDQAGVRVGVSQGSSSQTALGRQFRQAQVVPQASLQQAAAQLRDGQLDAFATNKAILYELADQVPGARVLDGRWGLEHMAMAIPKGRQAALPALEKFAATVREDGTLAAIVGRAGLRGTAAP